ncbi:unnamed protein product, partial [Ectocarpus sp. 12 AP-2014]
RILRSGTGAHKARTLRSGTRDAPPLCSTPFLCILCLRLALPVPRCLLSVLSTFSVETERASITVARPTSVALSCALSCGGWGQRRGVAPCLARSIHGAHSSNTAVPSSLGVWHTDSRQSTWGHVPRDVITQRK